MNIENEQLMCLECVCVMVTALHVLYVLVCGTIISWFCEYCVINLWNECFIITDDNTEQGTGFNWIGFPALSATGNYD